MDNLTYIRTLTKINGISMFDYIGSYLVIFLILHFTNTPHKEIYYVSILPAAVIFHIIFKQNTFITKKILDKEFNIYKAYLIFLVLYWSYLFLS